MIGSVVRVVKDCVKRVALMPLALAMGIAVTLNQAAMAQTPLIPASPVALEDYIAEGITAMGTIVGAVVGAWFVFMLVKKGLTWARRAF